VSNIQAKLLEQWHTLPYPETTGSGKTGCEPVVLRKFNLHMHRRRHSGSIDKVRIELEGLLLLALFISKEGCCIGCCIGHDGI
jgi:hypothetical protein